jgi:D-alanyl-D-alanine carboxypeptidase
MKKMLMLAAIGRLLLAATVMLAAAGFAVAQEPEGFKDAIGLLDAWTANRVASRGQPSVAVGVVLGDHLVWARGYGFADLDKKIPATSQTLYRIGSITKSFTAVSILQLRDSGKLQLDDPVERHLKGVHIQQHSAGTPDVTLRELLTHTSGLQREVPGTVWTDAMFPSEASLELSLTESYEPDTQWKYSNLGFALLGKVVAVEAGQPWDAYVQGHILTPLGMSKTRPIPSSDEPGLAVGYVRTAPGGTFVLADKMPSGPLDSAGAIASTVEDLAKYMAFHMAEGNNAESPILSGRTLREMHRPQWLLPDWQNGYGFGMRVRRIDGVVRVGHGGAVPGYTASIEFIPAFKLGVIVLTNSDEGEPASYTDYALQLLSPIVAKSLPHEIRRLGDEPKRFTGVYQSKRYSSRLVAILDGRLSMLMPDDLNPYTSRTLLEATDDPRVFLMRPGGAYTSGAFGEKLTFDVSADGTVTGFHTENSRYSRVGALELH